MPMSWRSCCAGPSRRSSARPANRSISACRRGRSSSPGEQWTRSSPRQSSPAPIGSPSLGRVPSSRSPIAVQWHPRRSPRIRRSHKTSRKPGFWRSPRPTACTAIGGPARARGEIGVAERLLARLRPGAALVTVGDFHPATLSWLGAVAGSTIVPLGVDRFGQSGDIADLYRAYGIDTDAILDAAARACLTATAR
jgi:hypothetical protein